jgi:hypothetical protein
MSNIANQLVAVAATLLGFVAHDVLTERQATEAAAARVEVAQAIDPVITRSIDLESRLMGRALDISMHNGRAAVSAPATRLSAATAPARLDMSTRGTELADIRIHAARSMAPVQHADLNALR